MGIQKIRLSYFLSKSGVGLKKFCELNDLKTYDELVEYCKSKNFNIGLIEEEDFNSIFPKAVPVEVVKEVVEVQKPKPKSKEKTSTRKRRVSKKSENSEDGSSDPSV